MTRLRVPVNEDDHSTGNSGAGIILLEYGDYQCPHCGHAYPLIKKLLHQFNSGLLFVFRNFPLQEVHPSAMIAALAAEAAGKQNKFWEMHDQLFSEKQLPDTLKIFQIARQINLNMNKFKSDFYSKEVNDLLKNNSQKCIDMGLFATPTILINDNVLFNSSSKEYIEKTITESLTDDDDSKQ